MNIKNSNFLFIKHGTLQATWFLCPTIFANSSRFEMLRLTTPQSCEHESVWSISHRETKCCCVIFPGLDLNIDFWCSATFRSGYHENKKQWWYLRKLRFILSFHNSFFGESNSKMTYDRKSRLAVISAAYLKPTRKVFSIKFRCLGNTGTIYWARAFAQRKTDVFRLPKNLRINLTLT